MKIIIEISTAEFSAWSFGFEIGSGYFLISCGRKSIELRAYREE